MLQNKTTLMDQRSTKTETISTFNMVSKYLITVQS